MALIEENEGEQLKDTGNFDQRIIRNNSQDSIVPSSRMGTVLAQETHKIGADGLDMSVEMSIADMSLVERPDTIGRTSSQPKFKSARGDSQERGNIERDERKDTSVAELQHD